jgi:hypothetical protein
VPEPEVESAQPVRCPKCSSYDVRRSYPKGLLDAFMNVRGWTPLRCRRCTYRFYRKLAPGQTLGLPETTVAEQSGR